MAAELTASDLISPIGLVAGSGAFPLEVAEEARKLGLDIVAVAHVGETDARLESLVRECRWIRVGQLGKLIRVLQQHGVRQAVFSGGIKKARLFGGVRFDFQGAALLARLRSVKDDVLLRGIAAELERRGIAVFSAGVLLRESLPKPGLLTARDLSAAEAAQARAGWDAAKRSGELEFGQTVVLHRGVVVAVEAVEGTDAAILRGGLLAETSGQLSPGSGCVVVKLAKPQQDLRLDLPAVGPQTIAAMAEAGATALVLEAGKALLLDPEQVVREANRLGIAIRAAESGADF